MWVRVGDMIWRRQPAQISISTSPSAIGYDMLIHPFSTVTVQILLPRPYPYPSFYSILTALAQEVEANPHSVVWVSWRSEPAPISTCTLNTHLSLLLLLLIDPCKKERSRQTYTRFMWVVVRNTVGRPKLCQH